MHPVYNNIVEIILFYIIYVIGIPLVTTAIAAVAKGFTAAISTWIWTHIIVRALVTIQFGFGAEGCLAQFALVGSRAPVSYDVIA